MKCNRLIIIQWGHVILISFIVCFIHFASARRIREGIWVPLQELDEKILINQETGRIKFAEDFSGLPLNFTLWAVRHGQTIGNITKGMFQGAVDEDINQLTEKGSTQAEKAARILFDKLKGKLKNGEEVVIVTSGLKRAKDTANYFIDLVKKETGITIEPVTEELASEISFGVWDNKTTEQIASQLGVEQKDLTLKYRKGLDARICPENGESFINLLSRSEELLYKLNKQYKGKTVVLFSHGTILGAIRTLIGDKTLLDKSGQIDWRSRMIPTASPVLLH